jgi:hypothetical protein
MEAKKDDWKTTTLIVGAVVGLIAGLIAAYIMIQRAEEHAERPRLSAGEGVKVGLGVLGVLRLISDLGPKH